MEPIHKSEHTQRDDNYKNFKHFNSQEILSNQTNQIDLPLKRYESVQIDDKPQFFNK